MNPLRNVSWWWPAVVVVALAPWAMAQVVDKTPSDAPGTPLGKEECLAILRELSPQPDEPWRTIPWRISLLEAQRDAAKQKKLIFIWAMDGHPLGCT